MELRQLRYFEAVARSGGFSRAAEQLHIAQPAISAQIRQLEKELGTVLLQRTTRRVTLTHAGELFLVRVRTVLAEIDAARAELDELAEVLRGHLRIGVTPVLGSLDFPGALAGFHRRYPELTLTVRNGLVAELLEILAAGDLDVVLGPVHEDLSHQYRSQTLATEKLVVITSVGHRTAGSKVALDDFADDPFVCLPANSGLHAILVAAAEKHGFTARIPFEGPNPTSIREIVAAGLGVALLAESAALADGPAIAVHYLEHGPTHPPIGMINLRASRMSPAVRAWQKHITRWPLRRL